MVKEELITTGNRICDELQLALADLRKNYTVHAATKSKLLQQEAIVESVKARFMYEASAARDPETGKPIYSNEESRRAYVIEHLSSSPEQKTLLEMRQAQNVIEAEILASEKENSTLRSILQWQQAVLTDLTWQRLAPTPDQAARILGSDAQ